MNNLNELTTVTNRGTLTVAGTATETPYDSPDYLTGVTVSGTGLSSGPAALYADGTWARTNATLANGNNTKTCQSSLLTQCVVSGRIGFDATQASTGI